MDCVIVDDELSARNTLKAFIEKFCPDLKVAGMAEGVAQAAQLIDELRPDLIFLDIQMPGENGFQLIPRLPNYNFSLIFTTAYDQYALRALKLGALDYLLKPIDMLELQEAVAKGIEHRDMLGSRARLDFMQQQEESPERLVVSTVEGYFILNFDDLLYLEADRNYTRIMLKNQRKIIASKTLKHFSEFLPATRFYRIHKSYIVNLYEVVRVARGQVGTVEMSDGTELEFSKVRKGRLLELLRLQSGFSG